MTEARTGTLDSRVKALSAKRVFLAATGQNRGKTTTSVGLTAAIRERGLRVGFLKPVGQRYLVVDGTRADEDAVLMQEVFDLPDALNDMSPVTLPRGFTTDFIMGRIAEDLEGQVATAFGRVAGGQGPRRHRGHRPRRRRRRHRPVERARGGHAGVAGHHRVGGRRRAADRRDRAQPRPLRGTRRARCSARWSTRSTSSRTRTCPTCSSEGSRSTGSSSSAASRTRSSSPTRRSS